MNVLSNNIDRFLPSLFVTV